MSTAEGKLTWRFPRTFWTSNVAELFERAAYYGAFIAMTLFLTRNVGFSDIETGWVVGAFASLMYFMPTFMGALSDRIGFKNALLLAFALLTVGYASLGAFPTKLMAIISLAVIMLGGAIVKPVITGTMAKCSDSVNRARAFSIFYQFVNIGSFSGKMVAKELRISLGLEYINFYAATMALAAFILVAILYKNMDRVNEKREDIKAILKGLWEVIKNVRFIIFLLIIGGFWSVQGQMYATMPKYTLRLIGESASPEWLANVNPFIVVLFVIPITQLVRKMKPISAMMIAMIIMPLSGIAIAMSPVLEKMAGSNIQIIGSIAMHPITIMMAIGIGMQGLAECFLSPRFLEYVSKLAPKDKVGLYMGYSNLKSFFSYIFSFVISGYLLAAYCPDPRTLAPDQLEGAYCYAHYIWYIYAGIGFVALIALYAYQKICNAIDRKHHVPENE